MSLFENAELPSLPEHGNSEDMVEGTALVAVTQGNPHLVFLIFFSPVDGWNAGIQDVK